MSVKQTQLVNAALDMRHEQKNQPTIKEMERTLTTTTATLFYFISKSTKKSFAAVVANEKKIIKASK